ncbi:MAG: hypothetical protein AAFR98_09615 [Pseudomonadota bacterium]
MADKNTEPTQPHGCKKPSDRDARLRAALKENLKRRKMQGKGRAAVTDEVSNDAKNSDNG